MMWTADSIALWDLVNLPAMTYKVDHYPSACSIYRVQNPIVAYAQLENTLLYDGRVQASHVRLSLG